ncbi:CD3324 family protein [Paenibacillus terricola]|uniref:CD3324 family protein n=1 Tax=Paenibacillus terricola TaxID=2763503 RepID=UPI00296496B8|nr:CD3324 family protein [Paenibacillus terricola]
MKYENANDLLPVELLREIQKYAAGKLLYVPSGDDKRAWGEASGYRDQLLKRNRMIRNKYAHGITISELADEYCLSLDSIKKIIYSKRMASNLSYSPTVASAVQYANAGLFEEWIQCYLLFTRKAESDFHEFLKEETIFFGVVKFPLRLIQHEGAEIGGNHTDNKEENFSVQPPLLIQYEAGKFYCSVQQELLASLKRRRVNAYPSIIVLKGNADYRRFNAHFGGVLFYVNE